MDLRDQRVTTKSGRVAEGGRAEAVDEVDILIAIDVPKLRAVGADGDDRIDDFLPLRMEIPPRPADRRARTARLGSCPWNRAYGSCSVRSDRSRKRRCPASRPVSPDGEKGLKGPKASAGFFSESGFSGRSAGVCGGTVAAVPVTDAALPSCRKVSSWRLMEIRHAGELRRHDLLDALSRPRHRLRRSLAGRRSRAGHRRAPCGWCGLGP